MKVINQFMWGYQPHFRMDLENAAKSVLGKLGIAVAPMALLIGFEEEPGGHPICVEPENLGIDPQAFADCTRAGDEAYEQHTDRTMLMTHSGLHRKFHADLLDRCRGSALAESLDALAGFDHRRWFVGRSVRVGRYRIYPAIGVLASTWDALPALTNRDRDHRTELLLSLQEAVIRELLASASFAMSISDEPQGLRYDEREELARRAASRFVRQLVYFKGDFMGSGLGSAMNLVAAQPYEGRTGVGTMLMAAERDYCLELTFENPIDLGQTRALRKALEMTDTRLHLVTNGSVAFGLGTLAAGYDPKSESAFFLRVIGRGSWELEHAGMPLMVVNDGQASVPRERLARSTFDDAVDRLFGDDGDVQRLWELARAASHQAHGTMLVVHADAASEAIRLSPPAMRVKPRPLTDSTLLAVSAIDGAIIVDPTGKCQAVGAILDGRATPGSGDASRGARFNSAHRYLAEADSACLIIIVSEDGMLNLIPDLPRRVQRSYVERVLTEIESLSLQNPVDFEAFHKREEHLRSLAFYLTPEQCTRGNDARERVERFRESSFAPHDGLGGITRIGYARLEPNPELDDSFFLPERDGPAGGSTP
ncbi:MAG: diadenylate cyclase [Blastococcus sp.]